MVQPMLKRRRVDPWSRSWAVRVSQDQAIQLTTIAKHLGRRSAQSNVAPAPFTGWVVQHDCCALVIDMKEQVSYTGMLKNVRRWCGQTYMDSLLWWDVVAARELEIVKDWDASAGHPPRVACQLGSVQKHGTGWRARVLCVTGPTRYGWGARTKAEADLAQARQASTREEMRQCLRDIKVASGHPAASSVAVGPSEQAAAAPSVAVAPARASSPASGPWPTAASGRRS